MEEGSIKKYDEVVAVPKSCKEAVKKLGLVNAPD